MKFMLVCVLTVVLSGELGIRAFTRLPVASYSVHQFVYTGRTEIFQDRFFHRTARWASGLAERDGNFKTVNDWRG